MPTLPLPVGSTQIGSGDLVVTSVADVIALLPYYLKSSDSTPVRDGLMAAIAQMVITYQERAGYAGAQSDILRATGTYQDGLFADRGVKRQPGELDTTFRARGIAVPNLVTPTALLAAANAVLAPYTSILPQLCESIQDRMFLRANPVNDGTQHHSFIYSGKGQRSPYYPDRLYPDDSAANGGDVRPQSNPGGARMYNDAVGRMFLLRVPDLSPIDGEIAGLFNTVGTVYPSGTTQPGAGLFVFSTPGAQNGAYTRRFASSAAALYQAISSVIDRIKGHSIRWTMIVDPQLT